MIAAKLFDEHEQDSVNHQKVCLNGKSICFYFITCFAQTFEALGLQNSKILYIISTILINLSCSECFGLFYLSFISPISFINKMYLCRALSF